jgi:hypothetical protein
MSNIIKHMVGFDTLKGTSLHLIATLAHKKKKLDLYLT